MSDGEELRVRGNALYQEGRFDDARTCYTQAISLLESASDGRNDGNAAANQQIAQLYSNRAQTSIQQRNFALALQDATRALECDPESEKAQLRRLVSLENLERFETAFQLVERILDATQSRQKTPALFEYAVTARRRLRKNIQQDKLAAQQESHAIGRMVHENQQLRINYGCLIPSHVPTGHFFDVAVNIGNEFGLFRRDYLPQGERIQLQCELRNNTDKAYKVVFREARGSSCVGNSDSSAHTPPVDGVVTLNDRGKAIFEVAIMPTHPTTTPSSRANMALALAVHIDSSSKWNLLPIVSLPFSVAEEITSTNSSAASASKEVISSTSSSDNLGIHCCRPVWLPTLNREILLAESPGNLGIGGKLWDSCLVLTRYFSRHKDFLANKRVIELGSGLGLVGMYCALLGAQEVTLTDIDEVIPLLDYNIQLNFPEPTSSTMGPSLRAVAHFWGTPTDTLPRDADVLVLSDVVYDPEGYAPLVTSLRALAKTPQTEIFMAHRSRNPMEHQFFELLAESFEYELVDWASEEQSKEEVEHDQQGAGDKRKDELALQDVKIFRISRRCA